MKNLVLVNIFKKFLEFEAPTNHTELCVMGVLK